MARHPHTYPPAGTGEVQRIRLADAAIDEGPQQWSQRLAHAAALARPELATPKVPVRGYP